MNFVFGQGKYTVSGEVAFSKEVAIYVGLHNQQTFNEYKTMPPGSFTQKIKAAPSGKAAFTFKDVPKGEYLIIAFADENANGKLDADTWGFILEPVWAYKQPHTPGSLVNWSVQKFEVDKDVTGIVLK